jgi:hypothetical protein
LYELTGTFRSDFAREDFSVGVALAANWVGTVDMFGASAVSSGASAAGLDLAGGVERIVTRVSRKSLETTFNIGRAEALAWDLIGERSVLVKSLVCDVTVAEEIPSFSL